MVKYFIKKLNGKLSLRNTSINRKTRRNYINFQIPKKVASKTKHVSKTKHLSKRMSVSKRTTGSRNAIDKKIIETLKMPNANKDKKMFAQFHVEKEKHQADIKSAIAGYKLIITQLEEKIKSNHKAIDNFNETIEENFKKMESLKEENEEIITLFKIKMENLKKIHNDSLIKDIAMCNKLIIETQSNIAKLDKELDKISTMGLIKIGTTF